LKYGAIAGLMAIGIECGREVVIPQLASLLAQAHRNFEREEDFEILTVLRGEALHLRTIIENSCRDIMNLNASENTPASLRMNAEIVRHLSPYSGYSFPQAV
jgi:hypothetical protein